MRNLALRRAVVIGLAILAPLLLLSPGAGPADAAPTWLTPGLVLSDPTHEAADVHVAVSPGGHTLVVWREQVGATYVVRMSERTPGGPWTVPVPLWSGPQLASSLQAVVDDTGRAAVAFTAPGNSGNVRVRVTVRSSINAAWPVPEAMGGDPEETTQPDLALSNDGEALVAYVTRNGADKRVTVVSNDGSSWDWWTLTPWDTFYGSPKVAVDAAGTPTVAWHEVVNNSSVVRTRTRLPDGSWSQQATQSTGSSDVGDLVTSGKGDVVLLWRRFNGQTFRLFINTRTPGGGWGSATPITGEFASLTQPHLAVDAAGQGTATYLAWNGNINEAHVTSQGTGGAWSGPVTLSDPGPSSISSEVVVDGGGVATVVWATTSGVSSTLYTRSRPLGGAWGPTTTLGPYHPSIYVNGSVGADGSGNVVVAWEGTGAHTVGRLVALDGAGPGVGVPALPTKAYVGKGATLSIPQPVDAWSTVSGVSWTFGDGGSASGLTARHTWKKSGSFPVTVTASDAVGNATSRSTAVQVIGRPRLSKLKLTRPQLQQGGQELTRLSFRLDTDAKLVARVRLLSPGRSVGARGAAGRVLLTLVRKHLAAGRHGLTLRTTMKGVRLPVGSYRVTLVATNPAGKGKARTVKLTVDHH